MRSLGRGLVLGLAFGVAITAVDFLFFGVGFTQRRMGPGPTFLAETALLEIALAALLGLVGAPLERLHLGRIHGTVLVLLWIALAWAALGRLAPFDAPMAAVQSAAPAIALGLVALGGWLSRFGRWLPWALGLALLAAEAVVPQAYVSATTPPTPARPSAARAAPSSPDVVLVVLDTVRASSVSSYGYERPTAPTLDALAGEGVLFEDATSPSTWSLPSHASLFTGRYPSSHGAHGEHVLLDDRFPTLAEVLRARGYETFCFTANAWISDGLGLTRGFDWQDGSYREHGGAGRNFAFVHRLIDRLGFSNADKGGAVVAANFAAWSASRSPDAPPAFVFLNFIEAHFPYHQLPRDYVSLYTDRPLAELSEISMALMAAQFGGPAQDPARVASPTVDMYDGGVAYTDELLRRVVDAIRARGKLDETVVIVLADHGELLGEKGGFFGHGPSLYQPVVSVPLLVRYPPRIPAGVRVGAAVTTLGVFGTILDLASIEPPPTLQAGSLVPLATGRASDGGPVLTEKMGSDAIGVGGMLLGDPQMRGDTRYRAYRSGMYKLVESSRGDHFLYDLAADPGEEHDLASARPQELARLRAELESVRRGLDLPLLDAELASAEGMPELDEATIGRLRELGYVE